MYFFKACTIGLLFLQSSLSFAIPTDSLLSKGLSLGGRDESGANLQKRYPIALNFDPSVSGADRTIINQAFQDMQTLAAAAANYNFANSAGNIDGIYVKYFPQGQEQRIQALFRYLAGINQQWGGAQLTTPDFSGFTIKRAADTGNNLQGSCRMTANGRYDITIYDLAMQSISPSIAALNFQGSKTSAKMESLGSVILHELLYVLTSPTALYIDRRKLIGIPPSRHASVSIVNPIMSYGSATDSSLRPLRSPIDDQTLPMFGKCYGGFFSNMLKQQNADKAFLNIDNYMYFALVSLSTKLSYAFLFMRNLAERDLQSGILLLSHPQASRRIWETSRRRARWLRRKSGSCPVLLQSLIQRRSSQRVLPLGLAMVSNEAFSLCTHDVVKENGYLAKGLHLACREGGRIWMRATVQYRAAHKHECE